MNLCRETVRLSEIRTYALSPRVGNNVAVALILNAPLAPQDGASPLFIAVQEGRAQIAEVLIAAGAKVDTKRKVSAANVDAGMGRSVTASWPCHAWALGSFPLGTDRLLLGKLTPPPCPRDPHQDGRTPLYTAAQNSRDGAIQLLLSKGADPNSLDEVRHLPSLPLAPFHPRGRPRTLLTLVPSFAPAVRVQPALRRVPEGPPHHRETPPCRRRQADARRRAPAPPTGPLAPRPQQHPRHPAPASAPHTAGSPRPTLRPPQDGRSPLWIACAKGFEGVAKALLEAQADPNAPNNVRRRPAAASQAPRGRRRARLDAVPS